MDEVEQLKRLVESDLSASDKMAIARVRHNLMAHAEGSKRSSRRRRLALVSGAAIASAAAAALVLGLVVLPGAHLPTASAAVVRVLDDAISAHQEITMQTGTGEYLRTRLVEVTWSAAYDGKRNVDKDSAGRPFAWKERHISTVWSPSDPHDQWVARDQVHSFGFLSPKARHSVDPDLDETWRAADGDFGPHWRYPQAADFSSYPRDPDALLDRLRTDGEGADNAVFEHVSGLLLEPGLPDDLRVAILEAMKLLPDIELKNDVSLPGHRSGVGLSIEDEDALVFDPVSGRFLGELSTTENPFAADEPVRFATFDQRAVSVSSVPLEAAQRLSLPASR